MYLVYIFVVSNAIPPPPFNSKTVLRPLEIKCEPSIRQIWHVERRSRVLKLKCTLKHRGML